MNYIKNIRNAALYSPYEIKVRDLTSNDPFAGNAQKARKDVAEATNNYESFLMTMRVLWERMNDTGKNWRHVYKGLQLLEYLLVYGHENVVHDAKNNIGKVKILRSFSYVDEQTFNDYGEGVRRLAERVLSTLGDDQKLDEYRGLAEKGQFQGFPKLTEPSKFAQKTGGAKQTPVQTGGTRRYEDDDEPRRQPQKRYDDEEEDRPRRKMEPVSKRQQQRYDDDEDDRPPQRQQQQPQRQQQRYEDEEDDRPPQRQPQKQQPRYEEDYEEQPRRDSQRSGGTPQNRPNQSGLDFFFDDDVEIAFNQGSQQRTQPQQQQPRQTSPQQQQQDYQRQPVQQAPQQYYDEPVADERGTLEELQYARSELQRLLAENEQMRGELADTKQKYEQLWKSLESRQ